MPKRLEKRPTEYSRNEENFQRDQTSHFWAIFKRQGQARQSKTAKTQKIMQDAKIRLEKTPNSETHKKFKHFKPGNIWTLRKGRYSNAKWSKNGDFGKILNVP